MDKHNIKQDCDLDHDEQRDKKLESKSLIESFQYPPKEILDRRQINQCWKDIEEMHPLKRMAKPFHVFPFCRQCCCQKKPQPDFKISLRHCLHHELNLPSPCSSLKIGDDPYLAAGYGVNSFFDILKSLAMMFFFMSLFAIPVYIIYSSGSHYKNYSSNPISQFCIGNIGGASVFCRSSRIGN